MSAATILLARPAVPLSQIAAISEKQQRAFKLQQAREDLARDIAARQLVEPNLLRLYEAAAKHAADRAYLLGRAGVYQARGDTDVSDVLAQSAAAGERLAAVERQIKEMQR